MPGGGTGPAGAGSGASSFSDPYPGETTTRDVVVPTTYPKRWRREHPHWSKDAVQRNRMDKIAKIANQKGN
jgi:hypothetical protein